MMKSKKEFVHFVKARIKKEWEIEEMQSDHIKPWSKSRYVVNDGFYVSFSKKLTLFKTL
jgi:hypothetical protein